MRFATISLADREQACVRAGEDWVALDLLDEGLRGDLLVLIRRRLAEDELAELGERAADVDPDRRMPQSSVRFAPPYRRPAKILGIGLNYRAHATDLSETAPADPASFIKGAHTIIGPGETIVVPRQSERTTTEAELGLIFGRETTEEVGVDAALGGIFGVCAVLDQTAEDILQQNPRFLTRSKNFRSFLSFGPEVVTLDEFLAEQLLEQVRVTTTVDGSVVRSDLVAGMTHGPRELIAFHSAVMPFEPGDILCTGTPGAGVIIDGAVATATVTGLQPLTNPVKSQDRR